MLTDSFVAAQIKRDIQWILSSPPLMQLPPELDAYQLLQHTPLAPHPDLPFKPDGTDPEKPIHRLGDYYEHLVNTVLENYLQPTDIKRNIQVIEDKKTLGEFDFLYRDQNGVCTHLECAIKFYLCTGDGQTLDSFEGPNRRDRLDLKWLKMRDKQSYLGQTDAGARTAKALGMLPDRRSILIQGWLFYPFEEMPDQPALCPDIAADHLRGWWLRAADAERLCDSEPTQFQILQKPHWLALPDPTPDALLSQEKLAAVAQTLNKPILIARLTPDLTAQDKWRELDRGFIVPDRW